jgi:glycosyltransferase involved in cell wall biosynthesis
MKVKEKMETGKKNKTAVGILMNTLDMGGAEKQSLLQAKLMSGEFDVHYIVQKIKPQLKKHMIFIEKEKINYVQLSGNIISRYFQLSSYIKKNNIQVLFAYLTLDNFLASFVSLSGNIKCIGGVRSSSLPFVKFYTTLLLQKYFLDFMVFNNHYGKELFIKRGFSSRKALVIQNCIDNIQEQIIRTDSQKIKILSVGRFTEAKDYMTALRAIHLLNGSIKDKTIEYIMVGDGELYQNIQTWIERLNLSNVTIVRNPDNVEKYYAEADIYLLSSSSEGLPNSIMEALNYSLPVVSTDVGDANYLVKSGLNGFLVPVKDYEAVAENLHELVSDPSKRIQFGLNGHRLLVDEFSETKFQETYVNLTRSLLENNPETDLFSKRSV